MKNLFEACDECGNAGSNALLTFFQPSLSTSKSEARKNLAELDEGELFMELIKDVANELDIDVLSHKILVNVGLLTHADRGSLFLVKGNSAQSRYLVAKLFDVTQNTGKFLLVTPRTTTNTLLTRTF
jgi:cGMP-specific 3',5'-cyclic phosphodiesterase, invertebrate